MRFCFTNADHPLLNRLSSRRRKTVPAKNPRSHQLANRGFWQSKATLFATTILAALLAIGSTFAAEQNPSKVVTKTGTVDAQTLLEKGRTSGSLPHGMVIRIGACLGEPVMSPSGTPSAEPVSETWEFASNQVHRVEPEYKDDKITYRRIESRPFDSKGLCKDLLEGKAIEIQARKGKGPPIVLLGTPFERGSRSIAVVYNGETILDLHETNGPALVAYRESDARAFGALYERLAIQARVLFKSKAGKTEYRVLAAFELPLPAVIILPPLTTSTAASFRGASSSRPRRCRRWPLAGCPTGASCRSAR